MDAELGPGLKRLIASVMDPPLMSVREVDIPVVSSFWSPAGIPLSAALPMMAVTILNMWAVHCTPQASPVHQSAPVVYSVHKFASEASSVQESAPEASPDHETIPVHPGVAASTAEPPEVVALTYELSVCPVTAKKAVYELSACWLNAFRHLDVVKTTCWSSNRASEWGRKGI